MKKKLLIYFLSGSAAFLVIVAVHSGFFGSGGGTDGDKSFTLTPPSFSSSAGSLEKQNDQESASLSRTWGNKDCSGSTNFDCYSDYYTNLVKTKGIPVAFADLKVKYLSKGYVVSQCHPLTHVIGRAAAGIFNDPAEAYLHGDSFCWSGYYHGVMEGIIGKKGLKKTLTDLNDICSNIPDKSKYGFNYYNCVHGLGHGLMAITQDELFKSLDDCGKLLGDWEQKSCASGVFMENVIVDGINHKTKYLRPAELLYPCTDVEVRYKNPCYLMQTSYVLKVVGGDFQKTFGWCRKADEDFRDTCYESLGRDASGRSVSNVTSTNATCLLGMGAEEKTHCVIGAVKDFISYFHSDVQAKELCNSFSDNDIRYECFATADSYYSLFQ